MEPQDFSNLSNEELTIQYKKEKQNRITRAFLIGAMIGISIFSAVNKGKILVTLFPFVIILIAAGKKTNYKALDQEMQRRNLK